jgi:hypothetical protein
LVRQVGVFIKDPPANSMASFNFTSAMPEEGMTFVFGSWICVANDTGDFHRHLVYNTKAEAPAAT